MMIVLASRLAPLVRQNFAKHNQNHKENLTERDRDQNCPKWHFNLGSQYQQHKCDHCTCEEDERFCL